MPSKADLHNRLAGEIVRSIVEPVAQSGGTSEDALVLLESVVLGVVLSTVRSGGEDPVLDVMVGRVKQRLVAIRLMQAPPAGEA